MITLSSWFSTTSSIFMNSLTRISFPTGVASEASAPVV